MTIAVSLQDLAGKVAHRVKPHYSVEELRDYIEHHFGLVYQSIAIVLRPSEVPLVNAKQRQTYYGVMNLYNQAFIVTPYERGDGESTIAFMKYLQALHPNKKLIIIWDRASYHGSEAVQAYLSQVNQGLEEKDWTVTFLLFAPNAPDQNPVEDVWLQGKNFLRRHFYETKTFNQVKWSFLNFLNRKVFNFGKSGWYLEIPQPVEECYSNPKPVVDVARASCP